MSVQAEEKLQQLIRDFGLDPEADLWDMFKLKEGNLDTFSEIWSYIFIWAFLSSLVVHGCATLIAGICLNKHPWTIWIALSIFAFGLIVPLTLGSVTSAVITWACLLSTQSVPVLYCCVFGIVQTLIYVIVSFTKLLATL